MHDVVVAREEERDVVLAEPRGQRDAARLRRLALDLPAERADGAAHGARGVRGLRVVVPARADDARDSSGTFPRAGSGDHERCEGAPEEPVLSMKKPN